MYEMSKNLFYENTKKLIYENKHPNIIGEDFREAEINQIELENAETNHNPEKVKSFPEIDIPDVLIETFFSDFYEIVFVVRNKKSSRLHYNK